jgi:hypothetical protein
MAASGQIDRLVNVEAGQTITVTEAKGISASHKFGKN